MSQNTLGDMATQFTLRRQNVALRSEIQRLTAENASGVTADAAGRVRGDFSPLNAIETSLRRVDGYKAATTEATLATDAMQAVLSTVEGMVSAMSTGLLGAANATSPAQLTGAGIDAEQKFRSAVAAFGAKVGDRTLFAGTATTGTALADADAILSALDTAVAGATTAAEVETAVSAWFDAPGGYLAQAYQGGPPLSPLAVAPDDTAEIALTAADPAVRDTLKAVALAAMLNRGVLSGNTAERAALAQASAEQLLQTQAGRTEAAARIGAAQQRITAATSRNSAEASSLKMARLEIVGVDPFEAAIALSDAQTKLDTLLAVTARAARFSLVDYL